MNRPRPECTRTLRAAALGLVTGLVVLTGMPLPAWAESAAIGEDVTIIDSDKRTIYEYYRGGALHQIKVVPDFGRPYYLVPADETQVYADLRQAGRLIPRWIVHEFRGRLPPEDSKD